jgi:hypothetical protein
MDGAEIGDYENLSEEDRAHCEKCRAEYHGCPPCEEGYGCRWAGIGDPREWEEEIS